MGITEIVFAILSLAALVASFVAKVFYNKAVKLDKDLSKSNDMVLLEKESVKAYETRAKIDNDVKYRNDADVVHDRYNRDSQ